MKISSTKDFLIVTVGYLIGIILYHILKYVILQ